MPSLGFFRLKDLFPQFSDGAFEPDLRNAHIRNPARASFALIMGNHE